MIATYEEIKTNDKLKNQSENAIKQELEAIETFIRGSYTHNKFYDLNVKFKVDSRNNKLLGTHPYLRAKDTIAIVEGPNEGLYFVEAILDDGSIKLDKDIFDFKNNYVIKVKYPKDVKKGCIEMLEWKFGPKEKVGIKSETLSRHTVTYEDSASFVNGYPISLLGFLEPHRNWRF